MQISNKLRLRIFGENNFKAHLIKSFKHDLQEFLKGEERIAFKKTINPKVSIIIPTFNGAHHTLRCMLSLVADRKTSFEVIVFDNGSTDDTAELLNRCDNIQVIKSPQNLGYIKANNAAAKHARGEFLLLLNNDTRIVEGSIQDSVNVFSTEHSVGAVGVRIKLATGKLQEAGCMIFKNGTSNGYLRYSRADDPRAMFMREVDYCSAIYLLLKRQQFLDLGGLDEIFAPAYYEETDLCMKLRAQGLRVIYTPSVVIEHFEFGSQSSKIGRSAILERLPIFVARWKNDLETQGFGGSRYTTNKDLISRRLVPGPRILLAARQLNLENMSETARNMISVAMDQGWQVTIVGFSKTNFNWSKFYEMFGPKVEVAFGGGFFPIQKLLIKRPGYFNLISNLDARAAELTLFYSGFLQQSAVYKFTDIEKFREKLGHLNFKI
jgi:O-antigen biosynthesis protein